MVAVLIVEASNAVPKVTSFNKYVAGFKIYTFVPSALKVNPAGPSAKPEILVHRY